MVRSTASVLFASLATLAESVWMWEKGGDMCGGVEMPCVPKSPTTAVEDCAKVAFGPCKKVPLPTAAPPFYMTYGVSKLMFVGDPDTYLTTDAQVGDLPPLANVNNGYLDFAKTKEIGSAKIAFVNMGGTMGLETPAANGYVAVAAYLVKEGTWETNTNEFYYSKSAGGARAARADSTIGAPDGPTDVCISPLKDGACGDKRTLNPGNYKFSIYGSTAGADYAKTVYPEGMSAMDPLRVAAVAAAHAPPLSFPNPIKYYAIRTKLKKATGGTPTVTFNQGAITTVAGIGTTAVTSMEFAAADGSLNFTFPQKYNIGPSPGGVPGAPTATKDIKIRISEVAGDIGAYWIDYLFDFVDLRDPEKYAVYDPDIAASSQGTASASGGGKDSSGSGDTGNKTTEKTEGDKGSGNNTGNKSERKAVLVSTAAPQHIPKVIVAVAGMAVSALFAI